MDGQEKGPPCGEHEVRLTSLEDANKEQWSAINQLRNRLPIWATIVISLLTFLLGISLRLAGK